MPLCAVSRAGDDGGRAMSCMQEHAETEDPLLAFNDKHPRGKVMPEELQVCLYSARNRRR